jgi:cell division protein ZapE
MTTPLEYYQQQITAGVIFSDPEQLLAMQSLQRVHQDLLAEQSRRNRLFARFHKPGLVKGAYLWGGVGIGKTFMMDCFYHSLPFPNKLRLHFHQFMRRVHHQLTVHQGEKDPLQVIATEFAQEAIVLCFDELLVSDITDAMLLGRLFKALFERGVCLVATSNTAPDELYKYGLQRSQFLPAIALIKTNTDVIHVAASRDYRLRHLQEAGVFYTPLNEDSQKNMEKSFEVLTQSETISDAPVKINDRIIKIKKQSRDVIWFDFRDICSVPRSQQDYLTIADQYKTVFISDIPVIQSSERDVICLFISLVDVMYDARVRLVISAEEPVPQLYNRGYMLMEYARTNSRLLEMQSLDYFADASNRDNA